MEDRWAIEGKQKTSREFALAAPGIRIAPSLLAADFGSLAEQVALVEEAGATVLHLDIMDGHFVPNISYGVPVISSLRSRSKMFFDAHLMISDPQKYAEPFVESGCDHITFHIETVEDPKPLIEHIRSLGASVGVSINPTTPVSAIESIVGDVDMVLVMSVWPGSGGQSFIADVLEKVSQLRERLSDRQRLEIDGGIDIKTIESAAAAGVDTFVAGTAVFRAPDPPAALKRLHELASKASMSVS